MSGNEEDSKKAPEEKSQGQKSVAPSPPKFCYSTNPARFRATNPHQKSTTTTSSSSAEEKNDTLFPAPKDPSKKKKETEDGIFQIVNPIVESNNTGDDGEDKKDDSPMLFPTPAINFTDTSTHSQSFEDSSHSSKPESWMAGFEDLQLQLTKILFNHSCGYIVNEFEGKLAPVFPSEGSHQLVEALCVKLTQEAIVIYLHELTTPDSSTKTEKGEMLIDHIKIPFAAIIDIQRDSPYSTNIHLAELSLEAPDLSDPWSNPPAVNAKPSRVFTQTTNKFLAAIDESTSEKGQGAVLPPGVRVIQLASLHDNTTLSLALLQYWARRMLKFGGGIPGEKKKKVLHIVHFNDVYLMEGDQTNEICGGLARFTTMLSEIRQDEQHPPLLLFSGDFVGPSLMSVGMKGRHMIEAFNMMGVNYATLGNHEFDYGYPNLLDCLYGSSKGGNLFHGSYTKWIQSNMTERDGKTPLGRCERYHCFVWDGVKVGMIGLAENWLSGCAMLAPGEAIYHDVFRIGEELAANLKVEHGVDIVIALTHCRLGNDKFIKQRCPSIDLLLGGHDHFYKCIPKEGIIKSGWNFTYLNEIWLEIRPKKLHTSGSRSASLNGSSRFGASGSMSGSSATSALSRNVKIHVTAHPVTQAVVPHAAMEALVRRHLAKLNEVMGTSVGRTTEPLDAMEGVTRFSEGLLTGFVTDVMQHNANADFALIGGAAVTGNFVIKPGPITLGDIYSWLSPEIKVMCLKLTGATVKKLLEVMAKDLPEENPSFPHCSANLSFTINLFQKPPAVEDIFVKGKPLDENAHYTVALEKFAACGFSKYFFVPEESVETLIDVVNAGQLLQWVQSYFELRKEHGSPEDKKKKNAFHTLERKLTQSLNLSQTQHPGGGRKVAKTTVKKRGDGGSSVATSVSGDEDQNLRDLDVSADPSGPLADHHMVDDDDSKQDCFYQMQSFSSSNASEKLTRDLLQKFIQCTIELQSPDDLPNMMRLCRTVTRKLLRCESSRLFIYDSSAKTLRFVGNPQHAIGGRPAASPNSQAALDSGKPLQLVIQLPQQNEVSLAIDGSVKSTALFGESIDTNILKRCSGAVFTAQCGTIRIQRDCESNPNFFDEVKEVSQEHINSLITFPLVLPGGKLIGVIQGINKLREEDWESKEGASEKKETEVTSIVPVFTIHENFNETDAYLCYLVSSIMANGVSAALAQGRSQRAEMMANQLRTISDRLDDAKLVSSVDEMAMLVGSCGQAFLNCEKLTLFVNAMRSDGRRVWVAREVDGVTKRETFEKTDDSGEETSHLWKCIETGRFLRVWQTEDTEIVHGQTTTTTVLSTRRADPLPEKGSILYVPVLNKTGESLFGVLRFSNRVDGSPFEEGDEYFAKQFAKVASAVLRESEQIEATRLAGVANSGNLHDFPVHRLGRRIKVKRGWGTVKRVFMRKLHQHRLMEGGRPGWAATFSLKDDAEDSDGSSLNAGEDSVLGSPTELFPIIPTN